MGGKKVTLGNFKIPETTRLLKQRKFRFPAAEMAWLRKFGYNINITKIWKARAYMLTPRDKLQFWKVRHRTLYTRKTGNARHARRWRILSIWWTAQ